MKLLLGKLAETIHPDYDEKNGVTPEFRALVERGWEATYSALFDEPGKPFVSILAPHHREAIEWHWHSRLAFLRGGKPEYWAYFPIWSRGHMKSTVARRVAVVDALLSICFGQPAYILYVSRNKAMATKHATSIETIITSKNVKRFCPGLSEVKKNEQGNSKGWKSEFIHTDAGAVFHFAGLDEGLAGGNIDDIRPTFIVPDDVDGRENGPVMGQSRFDKMTTEVLPMRQANTLVFWAQNLISRYTAMYRVHSGQARVLTSRRPTKPIPAIIGLETEVRTINGVVRDVIIAGTPTWEFYGLERCQEEINTIGLPAFKRECQHEVAQSNEGLILHAYNDAVHVVSESEFASVYGANAWKTWAKWNYNDWARTKTERHANVAGYITVSSQNTRLPGFTFLMHPMSFQANAAAEDVAARLLGVLSPFAYRETTWLQLIKDTLLRANANQHTSGFQDKTEFERAHIKQIIPQYSRPLLAAFNVRGGVMSHSEDTVRTVFNDVFGMNFIPSNPGKIDAVEDINTAMKIDFNEPHPFRPEQKGYSRWFLVAPDDTTAPAVYRNGRECYPPEPFPEGVQPNDMMDAQLARFQFSNWRFRDPVLTATGEVIDDPLKINDDFGQSLQMIYLKKLLQNVPLDQEEQFGEFINSEMPHLHAAELAKITNEEEQSLMLAAKQFVRADFDREYERADYLSDEANDYFREIGESSLDDDFIEL